MSEPVSGKARFSNGDQVRRQSARDQLGYVVKEPQRMGGEWWYPVFFGGNRPVNVPESDLEPCSTARTIEDLLRDGIYGNKESFSKLLTFTKLQFPLRNNIYSFKASRTDFKAYQFKPLLKFFENPKQRLLVADEVGLGKTIEAGLILSELRARHPETLDRVLVICPSALCLKWQTELRNRFNERFEILDSGRVRQFLDEFDREGESVKLKAICSVQTLRSRGLLEQWEALAPPIDLVIIDEAHHLRNPSTLSHRMGRALGDNADGLLLLTATPIHLGNANLFYLMRLLDPEQFGTNPDSFEDELGERLFEELVRANEPVVKTERMLRAQFPPDLEACMNCLRAVERGSRSQLFIGHYEYRELLDEFRSHRPPTRRDVVQMQRRLANLNLLGTYFTRSRKRDVEARVVRVAKSFSVHWTPQERLVYDAVTAHATEKHADKGAFALFLAMIPQRQIASCIPAAVSRYEKQLNLTVGGRDREESDFDIEDWIEDAEAEPVEQLDLSDAIAVWRAAGSPDSKFDVLLQMLTSIDQTDRLAKILIFAYFKPTLEYLANALRNRGYIAEVISGDYDKEVREAIMYRFRHQAEPKILLSSEVGSEGLDFEFCHVLVNYDLPWNPMVVEQRIGRLDRIGQQSQKISIFNLSIPGTIEERILNRLYSRIKIFEYSIGDLEPIIGEEIYKLTRDLFTGDLSPAQQEERIRQTAEALERKRLEQEHLEANSSKLIGADEFFNDEIGRIGAKKRFISAFEIHTFVREFLDRHFPDCVLEPIEGDSWSLKVTDRLEQFVKQHTSTDDPAWFDFLRKSGKGRLLLTFASEIAVKNREADFINVHHPLVRAIVAHYEEHRDELHPVSRISLNTELLPPGDYFYFVYRLEISGAKHEHFLRSIVVPANSTSVCDEDVAEDFLTLLITEGETLEIIPDHGTADRCFRAAEDSFSSFLKVQNEGMHRLNDALVDSRVTSIRQSYESRIVKKEELLKQAHSRNSAPRYLSLLEGTIRRLRSDYESRIQELQKERQLEISFERIAAGIATVSRRSPE